MSWWHALIDLKTANAAGAVLQRAVAGAAGMPGYAEACLACQTGFDSLHAPAGVVIGELAASDMPVTVKLVCEVCWVGTWDDNLRAGVRREFDLCELQPVHTGGRA
jgi:hypothetical protein